MAERTDCLWGDLQDRYRVECRNTKVSKVHENDVDETYTLCEDLYVTPRDVDRLTVDQACTVSKKSTFLSIVKPMDKEARKKLLQQCAVGCSIVAKKAGEIVVYYA